MTRSRYQAGPATDHYHVALGPDQTAGDGSVLIDNGTDDPAAVTTLVAGATIDGDTATFKTVIVQAGAPETGAADFWLATVPSDDMGLGVNKQPAYQLYVRNPDDDGWLLASAGGTRLDAGNDSDPRTIGFWDAENGEWIGLRIDPTGRDVRVSTTAADGGQGLVDVGPTAVEVRWWGAVLGAPFRIILDDTGLRILGIPTADPLVAGALYSNGVPSAGVPKALMVSGG